MKRILHKTGAWILTILLVAVTTGTTLFTHICFMNGEHSVSTAAISSCCTPDNSKHTATLTSSCCDDSNSFLKFNFTASTHRQYQPDETPSTIAIFDIILPAGSREINYSIYRDLPPPETGRDLLIQNSVFRI